MTLWVSVAVAGIAGWAILYAWPKFTANYIDYRARLVLATRYGEAHPIQPGETEVAFTDRVQLHVLRKAGVPPKFVLGHWLRASKFAFIPRPEVLEQFVAAGDVVEKDVPNLPLLSRVSQEVHRG